MQHVKSFYRSHAKDEREDDKKSIRGSKQACPNGQLAVPPPTTGNSKKLFLDHGGALKKSLPKMSRQSMLTLPLANQQQYRHGQPQDLVRKTNQFPCVQKV